MPPLPGWETVRRPDRSFARAITCAKLRAGKSGRETSSSGELCAMATAAKSRGGSRAEPRLTSGAIKVESEAYISVAPSGAARATCSAATSVAAPGRLSTVKDAPGSRSFSLPAISRAMMSLAPPGAKPTTMRICRAGRSCAAAGGVPPPVAIKGAAPPSSAARRPIRCIRPSPSACQARG
jgi:hypothetical protein